MATFQAHGYTYTSVEDLVCDQLIFNPAKGESTYSIQAKESASNLTVDFITEYANTLGIPTDVDDLPF